MDAHNEHPSDALSKDELAGFRQQLLDLREDLRAQDAGSAASRAPVALDQQSVGRLSRMDAIQQQAMAEAEARRRRTELARVEAALDRMAKDEFGWCDGCGEPIAKGRLSVDPMATRCIACAD
jgi:DnaK suppressor protein